MTTVFNSGQEAGYPVRYVQNGDNSWSEVVESVFNPVGAHQYTSGATTPTLLTPPDNATKLLLQTIGQNIRYSLFGTGTVINSQIGFQLKTTESPVLIPLGPGTSVKVIQEAATAVIQYQWGN